MRASCVFPQLRRFVRQRCGNVAIVFGLSLPLVVGGAGLGVETTYWYYKHLQLQSAANQAAYAGAIEIRAGSSTSTAQAAALSTASTNGFDAASGTLTFNTPPTSGTHQNSQAVEVILREPEQRFFSQIFSSSPVNAQGRAVAAFSTASGACILALDPSASKAANFSGSSAVTLNGCSVMANSVAPDAVNLQGAGQLTTDCLISVGGAQTTNNVHYNTCTAPITNAPPVADPFANIPAPSTTGACQSSSGAVLQPGIYCGGLTLQGAKTLSPGTYVVEGDFKTNANAVVVGSGVTIYVTSGGKVSMNGNATVTLSAPTSGTYSGLLLFGDRTDASAVTLNGTAASQMTGNLYFSNQAVSYLGNFSGLNGCVRVVGRTVQWSGNTSVSDNCTNYGMQEIPAQQVVALVE
jgi:Flp pilus assembly protein TadG